ncbi:MAG: ATP-binding response regulator, partial [Acidimicrobiales bacterium]
SALLESAAPSARFWISDAPVGSAGYRVEDLQTRLPRVAELWPDGCPEWALAIPLTDASSTVPVGTAVLGLNPHRPLDDQYLAFCRLLADQIVAGIANAGAYEAERARAESLAELDRAKTLFLTNVSHELRTPLTLMLGPAEDALALVGDDPELRKQLEVVARNGRRLLRLVNSLLDFARIEAGRASAQRVEIDVGELTADIASAFDDVCRRAGLELVIDCEQVVGRVDPHMWETIVFNLLSNAFKFTFLGSITVRVAPGPDDTISLSVADTGVGIAESELPRVFERFYRPQQVEGRSMEGSGIGLALVENLVTLHGGSISVTSRIGAGTTFSFTVPASDPVGAPSSGPAPRRARRESIYVTEAAQWLESAAETLEPGPSELLPERPIVLVADDNADLREHLVRVIGSRWSTLCAADGRQALDLVRRVEPDLVIADVMMPMLDGFGLIKAMRDEPLLESIPVMILSARAGLEATGEGFDAGADDYLVKPFKSTELLNRVAARLRVATREHDRRERQERAVARAGILVELGALLSAAADVEGIVDGLLSPALSSLDIDAAGIGVVDADGELLRMTYGGSLAPELLDRYHAVSLDAPVPVATVVKSASAMVVPDSFQLGRDFHAVVSDA